MKTKNIERTPYYITNVMTIRFAFDEIITITIIVATAYSFTAITKCIF